MSSGSRLLVPGHRARAGARLWLDAFVSGTEVQQAARRLAQGLETR